MEYLLIGSLSINLFCAALLLAKPRKHIADWLLSSWFALIAVNLSALVVVEQQTCIARFSVLLWFSSLTPLLHGPLLWLYTRALTRPGFHWRLSDAVHGIPFMLTMLLMIPDKGFAVNWAYGLACLGLGNVAVYGLAILHQLKRHARNTAQLFSFTQGIQLRWLRNAIGLVLGVGGMTIVSQVLFLFTDWHVAHFGNWYSNALLAGGFMLLAFFGVQQQTIYSASLVAQVPQFLNEDKNPPAASKYVRSGLDETQLDTLFNRLRSYMEGSRAYQHPELSLPYLAAQLSLPVHHVSQVINQRGGQTFFDFVNQYRVEGVVSALKNGEQRRKTLLGIALENGFNSKASFNRAFKKFTGLTPQAYVSTLGQQEQPERDINWAHPTG